MTPETILDHMPDPETIGVPLDLSRSELRPLLRRYHPRPGPQATKLTPPKTALIVDGTATDPRPLAKALGREGWTVTSCHGPGHVSCPLMRGSDCDLRRTADVAIVYVNPDGMWPASGTLPRIRCAADSSSPAIMALDGRLSEPAFAGNHATIGAERDPRDVIDVVEVLRLEDRT